MRKAIQAAMAAAALIGYATAAHGYIGLLLGVPGGAPEFGRCEASELLEPSTGNLFVVTQQCGCELRSILNDGALLTGCRGWSGGYYDCPTDVFLPPPPPENTAWAILPAYPPNEDPTHHGGWVLVDSTAGDVADLGFNVTQALRPISAAPVQSWGGGPVYFSYRFHAVVEFGRDRPGAGPSCRIGGDPVDTTYTERIIDGYNVYRVDAAVVHPRVSTPEHYLLGPDLTPGTGDEGWIAFVPSGSGAGGDGLDLSDSAGPASRNDNDRGDAFGIEGEDWDGDTIVGPYDDAILIYSDNPNVAPNPPDPPGGCLSYVFQPVLKWADGVACPDCYPNCVLSDLTGDGIDDAVDLDGDTRPEFIDPSGNGLGLTADLMGERTILISPEMEADGGGATPAAEAIQLEGVYDTRSRSFKLQLVATLEADLAGYHLHRTDSRGASIQVNDALIPAAGTSLSTYEITDPTPCRGQAGTVLYEVEAIDMQGASVMHGPFAIACSGAGEAHRARAIR